MKQIQQAPVQIKVVTKRFSLKKGKIYIKFSLNARQGIIKQLKLKQRNTVVVNEFYFELTSDNKNEVLAGEDKTITYKAVLDVNNKNMEVAFWDVVALVNSTDKEDGSEKQYDAILGGLSVWLKLKLIAMPQWTKTKDGNMIYPFVNGARQFTIQYRKYDKRYDSYIFIMKEYLALFCYFILKPYWDSKKLWLICEKLCTMAQDNGYYFFKYCMENLPKEQRKKVLYVIDKSCPDFKAVSEYDDNVIEFMSFKYMIYLCAAQYLISTDAIRHFYIWDSPNSIYKVLYQARKNIIFLQHGVMGFKQCHRTFHKNGGNKMALFVVSSEYEKKIIRDYFEYDDEEIIVTGLARWDVLEDKSSKEHKEILLMPTWRNWLEDFSKEEFKKSDYFINYEKLLTDERLLNILESNNVTMNFYIHPKFREHISSFNVDGKIIKLIPFGTVALNELLMRCNMLITDYSSVSWDVYYQEKPIIFYPFDLDTYEEVQGSYMDYKNEVFGEIAFSLDELIEKIDKTIKDDFAENEKFVRQREYLLPLRDHNNSKRIYECICKADIKGKLKSRFDSL